MLSFKPAFSLSSFTFVETLVPRHFLPSGYCHLLIYVADLSPGNLDSSLCFVQSGISHDVLCILKLNKQSDSVQP